MIERAGLTLDDIDAFEINEAFASVVLAWQKETGVPLEKVNINGGATAIGHPLGASGDRLMTILLSVLEQTGGRYGIQVMCEAGGQASATIIEGSDMIRQRTYTWQDPAELAAAARGRDGLTCLNDIGSGRLPAPPAGTTTGIVPLRVADGFAAFELDPQEWHYTPIGAVHGGSLATLADTALGCAVHSQLPAGIGYTSLDLTIKCTRAVIINSAAIRCEANVVSTGRRVATAEARLTDRTGKTIGHAVATCLIRPMPV